MPAVRAGLRPGCSQREARQRQADDPARDAACGPEQWKPGDALDPLPGRWPYPARALLMVLLAPSVTRRLITEFARRGPRLAPPAMYTLTAREVEVLRLLAGGLSNSEIAAELYIGEGIVKTHVALVGRSRSALGIYGSEG